MKPEAYGSRGIESMRGALAGERAWLLGNGPSLATLSPEDIEAFGGVSFGVNRSWKRFPQTNLHVALNGANFDDVLDGRVRAANSFVPQRLFNIRCGGRKMNHVQARSKLNSGLTPIPVSTQMHNSAKCGRPFGYRFDRGSQTSTFAGFLALQLAVYLGFAEVFLVGYDAHDGEAHFYDSEVPAGFKRHQMVPWFDEAARVIERETATKVYNLNPESAIRAFEFRTKEEVSRGTLEDAAFALPR